MAKLLGRSDLAPTYQPERAGDIKHSVADLNLATSLLDYHPVVSFERGLQAALNWYQSHR
jgi:UDP-N-acetylglucosamine 4-epimerase